MLKVVQENTESNVDATVHGGSLLDEIVRDGARQMLAAALQAEVAAYVERFAGEVDEHGHRLVVRNGYHAAREVTTAAGAVTHRPAPSTKPISFSRVAAPMVLGDRQQKPAHKSLKCNSRVQLD